MGMKHCFSVCVGMLCLSVAPCVAADIPPAIEGAMQRYVALPDALLPVLEAAKDRKSADAAAGDLEALLSRVYAARKEMSRIPSLSPEVSASVRSKYEQQMRTRWGKVYDQIYRLQRVKCYMSVPYFKHFSTLCRMLES